MQGKEVWSVLESNKTNKQANEVGYARLCDAVEGHVLSKRDPLNLWHFCELAKFLGCSFVGNGVLIMGNF